MIYRIHEQKQAFVREPLLSELLDEPIIQDVMRSDRIRRQEIEELFTSVTRPASRTAP